MNYLSIGAILKNEEDNLAEWLHFHYLAGVERFYLFDNNSTDRSAEIIQSFPHQEAIRYIPWPQHPGQRPAYQHVIDHFHTETRWCAFIDIDEFLFGTEEDDLRDLLARYDRTDISALAAHWLIFGSSGRQEKPDGLLIENFQQRAPDDFTVHRHPKSILKLTEGIKPVDPHLFRTLHGTVNEKFEPIAPTPLPEAWTHETVRINHYFCKSAAEWKKKQARGSSDIPSHDPTFLRPDSDFTEHDRNEIHDPTVLRFAERVKQSLAGAL